jgi:hypothetical protein
MPVSGPKPTGRQLFTGNTPRTEWLDVPNVSYDGNRPELPTSRMVMNPKGELQEFPIETRTRDWWEAISKMPHCAIWEKSDWQFALDTAMVHADAAHGKTTAMGELRQREKIMGTTVDARRDLRIRYVEPEVETLTVVPVASIDDRRQKLLDA